MMGFDDPKWNGLLGGYRVPYDPRNALRSLEHGTKVDEAWSELWNELYHQGDVGEASYAAVPQLVRIYATRNIPDWNTYALAATIEEARRSARNPEMPLWLRGSYEAAWCQLVDLGLRDLQQAQGATLICSIIAAVALGKGQPTLARMAMLTEDERKEMLDTAGWG